MTVRIRRDYRIGCSPDEVTDFLLDHRNELRWNPEMQSVERLDGGPLGPGARFLDTARVGGRRVHVTVVLLDHEPGRLVRFSGDTSTMDLCTTYAVQPAEGGALLDFAFEATLRGAARLAPFVVRRLMERRFDRILPAACRILENTAA